MRTLAFLILGVSLLSGPASGKPKLPPCPPKQPQLFISPMGEPFRAGPDDAYPVAVWFAHADANGDGRLVRAEFIADAERFYRVLDQDHDGEITPEEVIRYERDIAPEIRLYSRGPRPGDVPSDKKRKRKNEPAYGQPMGAGRWGLLNIPQPVISADADFNRGITLDEFRAAASERFDAIDATRSGALTLAGLPLTPVQAAAINCISQPAAGPERSPPAAQEKKP